MNRATRLGTSLPPAAILLAAAVLALLSPNRLNHDCALYLECARLLLEGQRPYVDFVDLNPPFIFYLNVVPVLLSSWLWAPLPLTLTLGVLVLAAWSTIAIQRSLASVPRWAGLALPAGCVWAAITFALRSSNDFGQREHLLLLLMVPHVVARGIGASDPAAPRARWRLPWRGLAAGIAICIKPHYLPVAAAVEVWGWARDRAARRFLDREGLTLWVPPLLYLVHFALLPAEVRDAFFGRWLPLVAARYSVYDESAAELFHPPTLLVALAGLVAAAVAWRRRPREASLETTLGVFVAGGLAVYLLQHKGWPYHRFPIVSTSALLLALAAGRWLLERSAPPHAAPVRRAALVSFALGVIAAVGVFRLPLPLKDPPGWEQPLAPLVRAYSGSEDPVLIVSTGVHPAYPLLLETDRRPGSRYLWFFPIPMLAGEARASTPGRAGAAARAGADRLDAEEQRFLRDLEADLTTRTPALVLVSTRRDEQGCPPDFTVFGYLERHGVVARIARGRTRLPDIEDFAVFADSSVIALRSPPALGTMAALFPDRSPKTKPTLDDAPRRSFSGSPW